MVAPQLQSNHIMQLSRKTRPGSKRRHGAAVVELAITVPLLSLLAFGIVEYSQYTHAAQVVSNASRRGARFAARNETASAAMVQNYVRDYITGSFGNLTAEAGNTAITVNVADGAGATILNGDLSATNSGTPVTVNVSLAFEAVRVLPHFGALDQKVIQTSTIARRE